MAFKRIYMALVLFLVALLTGCEWKKDQRPSFLLIAVESLGFFEVVCGSNRLEEPEMAGFKIFCEDSVRFTHAYTPSLLSQPAMASILTGLYPHEHKVFHNGPLYLSAEIYTAPEAALDRGYQTSLFSGGAPLLHSSGLGQGFEIFEDNLSVDLHRMYRPASENIDLFLSRIDEYDSKPFFSVLYFNDLLFPDVTTVNDLGEIRDRSFESQMKEIGESLNHLVSELKARNLWDSTYVIFTGLNGQIDRQRRKDLDSISLYSPSTQVGLFIKPSRKKSDMGVEWSQDRNVSLVDIGETLFDLLGTDPKLYRKSQFDVVSLKSALVNPEPGFAEDREIWMESDWPEWREIGGRRVGARKGHYLIIFDSPTRFYNTLIDRLEVNPVSKDDPILRVLLPNLRKQFVSLGYVPWSDLTPSLLEKLQISKDLWSRGGLSSANIRRLRFLAGVRPWDQQLVGWQAFAALATRNWNWLAQLGEKNKISEWSFVAASNLKKKKKWKLEGCAKILTVRKGDFKVPHPKECSDHLLLQAAQWLSESDAKREESLFENFWRNYRREQTDIWVSRKNYSNSLIWDTRLAILDQPTLAELLLALPQHRKAAVRLKSKLSRKDLDLDLGSPFEF